jgi:hypothetical protein
MGELDMIEQIGTQTKVTIDSPKWLLMCDEEYYYSLPKLIPRGVTWCGRPAQLFETEQAALQYITDYNLVKYEPESNEPL